MGSAPMNIRTLLLGVLAAFTANVAKATVYFDSVHVTGANADSDGASDGRTSLAQSFTVSTPNFTSITLDLRASVPSDSGALTVYLVPDDGTGKETGIAGDPQFLKSGGTFTRFANAAPVGTISDASIAVTPTLVSLPVAASTIAAVTAKTFDDEYWLALVLSGNSSAEWNYNSGTPAGFGTTGQAFFNNFDGGGSTSISSGAYELIVSTPEPMTIAVLWVGMAGLGYVRRRHLKRS